MLIGWRLTGVGCYLHIKVRGTLTAGTSYSPYATEKFALMHKRQIKIKQFKVLVFQLRVFCAILYFCNIIFWEFLFCVVLASI